MGGHNRGEERVVRLWRTGEKRETETEGKRRGEERRQEKRKEGFVFLSTIVVPSLRAEMRWKTAPSGDRLTFSLLSTRILTSDFEHYCGFPDITERVLEATEREKIAPNRRRKKRHARVGVPALSSERKNHGR